MLQQIDQKSTVIVVGAGPVGLMSAILLARQGLRVTLVERYRTRLDAPKAHALNPRTLEICRSIGFDMEALQRHATPRLDGGWVRFVTTLAGEEIGAMPYERQDDAVREFTPTPLINLAQPIFEDFLIAEVARYPLIELRRGVRWISCTQTKQTVTSLIEDTETQDQTFVTTRYVIGADGAGSAVRQALAIEMVGDSEPQAFITIHFAANLRKVLSERPGILYWIMQPPHTGVLIAYDIGSRWCMLYPHDPAVMPRESFTTERCMQIVRHAIGEGGHPIEIKHVLPWALMSQVADRYREGGVFLVGDAAHRFPPTGGLGLNTGLQDAHNLAWKIAAVDQGRAPDALLDSYHAERHAVAVTNSAQSYKNAQRILKLQMALKPGGTDDAGALLRRLHDPVAQADIQQQVANQREHFDSLALQLGFVYGPNAYPITDVSDFRPQLLVGGRMPHAWLMQGGKVVSLLDLLDDRRFTLLVGMDHQSRQGSPTLQSTPSIRLVAEGIDFDDPDCSLRRFVDLAGGEAILVRPDGHVAAIIPSSQTNLLPALMLSIVRKTMNEEPAVSALPEPAQDDAGHRATHRRKGRANG